MRFDTEKSKIAWQTDDDRSLWRYVYSLR